MKGASVTFGILWLHISYLYQDRSCSWFLKCPVSLSKNGVWCSDDLYKVLITFIIITLSIPSWPPSLASTTQDASTSHHTRQSPPPGAVLHHYLYSFKILSPNYDVPSSVVSHPSLNFKSKIPPNSSPNGSSSQNDSNFALKISSSLNYFFQYFVIEIFLNLNWGLTFLEIFFFILSDYAYEDYFVNDWRSYEVILSVHDPIFRFDSSLYVIKFTES